ncbi:MFS transporter [Kitasatospora viridis]|uniref:Putative MFS family arabinose efflux permease n=1 Tax=Kitasatospora viridis TaxID=281105 RepID=A0A561UPQ0_9ACTN|nr:MFS transporter [Kitasatospora viridis]TWG01348.1 putative MFS family arabinose efflux permease [Kitasatospora viridis]
MFGLFRHRTYRHLFAAQVIALTGTGLATVALSLLAYGLAGARAGEVLGTALAIKMVAFVGFAPLVGAHAHRLPRRVLLVGADLIRAGVALALPFVDRVWQVYLLIFVLQAASAAFTPAFQSLVPEVLTEEREYTRALSLASLAYDLENLCSPALAAGLLAVLTYHQLFFGTVVGFLASAALVVSAVLPKPVRRPVEGGALARSTAGVRLLWREPRLRALLALNLAVAAGGAVVYVNTVVYVRHQLHLGAGAVAFALGAYGAGSMTAALLLPRVLERVSDRVVLLGGGFAIAALFVPLTGLTMAGGRGSWQWPTLLAVWAALGAACASVNAPAGRLIRRCVSAERRADAFAAQFSLSHSCWLLTYPLAGWLGATAGLAAAVLAQGALAAVAAVAAARIWRPERSPARRVRPLVAA